MKWRLCIGCILLCFVAAQSFIIHPAHRVNYNSELPLTLSGLAIFHGRPADLVPASGFIPYDLSTPLFSDYAEKQRFIQIPAGLTLRVTDSGLPEFPDGTLLVKTFYYYNDSKDTSKGKRIIETRVLVKSGGLWKAGTYVWNGAQTEAVLAAGGSNTRINTLSYHIPSNKECATCHNAGNVLMPIGFTLRNLTAAATRHLQAASILPAVNPASFTMLPDWQNDAYTLEQRARAYMDINCAHCHNPKGSCSASDFHPAYELSLQESNILNKKKRIVRFMKRGRMPRLGTTIVHTEGLALIEAYINSLEPNTSKKTSF